MSVATTIGLIAGIQIENPSVAGTKSNGQTPLVVDLDGTLTHTDTLLESVLQAIKRSPSVLLRLPLWLLKGRAAFKENIAKVASISAGTLPYNHAFLSYLREQKAFGRRLILATAAHQSIADAVAGELKIFDQVISTEAGANLKGSAKLEAIRRQIGCQFVYAGDSQVDKAIWSQCDRAIIVGTPQRLKSLRGSFNLEREFACEPAGYSTWLRALRTHQWMKNLLLFVPLLTSFRFGDRANIVAVTMAFLSFCFTASATYVVNDLWDLENDRSHPRKKNRPIASGRIQISTALLASAALLVAGIGLAYVVSVELLLLLLIYLVITSAYSWFLKELILVDVLVLAVLYTLRIFAGSVVLGVTTTSWLLGFSVLIFLSLALVKRCSELVLLSGTSVTSSSGRDYRVADLPVLLPLGIAAGVSSVIVFLLFVSAAETQASYSTPQVMWLVGLALMYWIARLWIKTIRGEMHDDPLVFALKDHGCRVTVVAMIVGTLVAHFLTLFPS